MSEPSPNPFDALTQLPQLVATMEGLIDTYAQRLTEAEARRPMNRQEVLQYLRVSDRQLLEYRRRGLPCYGSGKSILFLKNEVDAWLAQRRVNRHTR
ncbi:helix-turn-helix domain-containing protein [Rudanella paleaurantiibacter]|uniref:Helix-turn-helix domain-containing protein n=1 Tax=Rudanella paleaurantiibacter TaxID=2614655 RepID=A0A7J5TY86_9BACT|nr:helix-turn-helix domain-containing protein [Rudanella paleaurantiibacter]KAB7730116.1 helix-turn-helix domain-containing protein [Rudanella paleaurantiibacter]